MVHFWNFFCVTNLFPTGSFKQISLFEKPHTPFMSKLNILPELFGKVLAFVRFDDYNYAVIL